MPRASIILPVYNVDAYLEESLASVQAQTIPDIEIICVDDGSTDKSGSLLDAQATQDPRITVIHQTNQGPCAARNAGLAQAHGDFIIFLDADDLLKPFAVDRFSRIFDETNADIIICGGQPFPQNESSAALEDLLDTRDAIYEGFDMALLMKEKTHPFAWRTVCTRAFLQRHNLQYNESTPYAEDQVFQFAAYRRSSKTVLISDKLIQYRVQRDGSSMKDMHQAGRKRRQEHLKAIDAILLDWDTANLLDGYEYDMFDWTIDFVIFDLLLRAHPDELAAFEEELARIWRAHFSEEFLNERLRERRFRQSMRMVLEGAPRPSRMRATALLAEYMFHRRGLRYLVKRYSPSFLRGL